MRSLILAILFSLLAMPSTAQTPEVKDALKNFLAQVHEKPFAVRGSSADAQVRFQWTDTGVTFSNPTLHTIDIFSADSVKLNKDKLRITGKRHNLVQDKDGRFSFFDDFDQVIMVDLQGGDPVQILPVLVLQLFYPTIRDAIAQVPVAYAELLPIRYPHVVGVSQETPSPCLKEGAKLQTNSVVHHESPHFPMNGAGSQRSVAMTVVFTLKEDGRPADLWIGRSAGNDMDDPLAQSIFGSLYKAATCDGVPVRSIQTVDVVWAQGVR